MRKRITALGLTAVFVAGTVATPPAARAAEMAETYEPYFDIQPQIVEPVAGDFFSTPVFYELKGVPQDTSWDFIAGMASTYKRHCMAEKQGAQFRAQLFSTESSPLRRGVNSCLYDVKVVYPDMSSEYVEVRPQLIPTHSMLYEPAYEDVVADPGQRVELRPFNLRPGALPEDATWSLLSTQHDAARWKATLDPKTGTITATVPDGTREHNWFEVEITFADNTVRKAHVAIRNSGKGVVDAPVTAPEEQQEPKPAPQASQSTGSSTIQIVALVLGVLALIGGAVALAWPLLMP